MTTIYNRRDIGFTIISRFEETFRGFLIGKLEGKYSDFKEGIPPAIISKTNERSPILYWDGAIDFFEHTDFPDLQDISVYKENFSTFFGGKISKDWFTNQMTSLYGLRCKIAHVKGFFTSIDLDKLIELSKELSLMIDSSKELIHLIGEIERNPESVVIRVPVQFNIDYLESNGISNNLPTPDYEYEGGFVGRETDIKEITRYLQREKFPVVTITGAGGVGKTSLALKVIQEITQKPQSKQFDAIVWLSAKENKLSPFGIEEIEPSLKSYEELLDTIIKVLGFGIELSNPGQTVEVKETTVNTLFEIATNVLIIIDNLETITDERIINFIIDAPQKTKFLVTSRKGLGQIERRYELKQLVEKEAIYLFRQLAKDKQIQSLARLEDGVIKKYVSKVSNYPLAIKWVLGQVARGRDINKVIDSINDATGDISKFCFEQIFGLLSEDSKRILYALCLLEEPPTFSLLRYVVEIDNSPFDDCIEELILVSLVVPEQYKNDRDEIARKFYILPLTKGYVRQQLNSRSGERDRIFKRIGEVENTKTASEQARREYTFSMHDLGAESEEEKIAAIFSQTAFQRYQAGSYDQAVENYRKAASVAPRFSSIYRNWGVMESYENHLSEAEQLMKKASELNQADPQIWLLWGNVNRKAYKVAEADEKYKQAFNLSPDNHLILNAYGQTRGRLGDYSFALELLTKSMQSKTALNSIKHIVITRSSIAEVLIRWSEFLFQERDREGAKQKLLEALSNSEAAIKADSSDPKSLGILVKTYYKLGKFYSTTSQQEDAISVFKLALAINSPTFKVTRYRMKSAIELSKVYYELGQLDIINDLLKPLLEPNNIFKVYPEILDEINQILTKIGTGSELTGSIKIVSLLRDYILIETKDNITYIASKTDFNPKLNSLSRDLKGRKVSFIPKVYRAKGKDRSEAKNIKLIG